MSKLSLRERAIGLLARRDHSRAELAHKLAPHGTEDEIDVVIARMIELGLLSDERFAQTWVRSKAGRFGLTRLRYDLAQRGVDRDTIDAALESEAVDSEIERARAVWHARFSARQSLIASDRKEWARQARFLQSRGFSTSVISKLLKESPDDTA
jgi:regulatory protein